MKSERSRGRRRSTPALLRKENDNLGRKVAGSNPASFFFHRRNFV